MSDADIDSTVESLSKDSAASSTTRPVEKEVKVAPKRLLVGGSRKGYTVAELLVAIAGVLIIAASLCLTFLMILALHKYLES